MSSSVSPTYLITAASGNIGKRLIPLLLSQASKPTIILPTRNPDGLKSQLNDEASESRVKIVHGDIQDSVFLEKTLKSYRVTAAFVCLTGENELIVTLNLFDAMKRAGTVKHLVYLSASGDFSLEAIQKGAIRDVAAGHVLVKHIVEAKLRHGLSATRDQSGGFSWTIIGPSLFFDNDFRSKQSMLDRGFFDEPLGNRGVSRVDPGDIALAVANALEDDGKAWAGKKVMIGSSETYTNIQAAKLWSEALGTEITPAMSDEDGLLAFEEHFRTVMNPVWARDMRLMYEWFDRQGFAMSEDEYREQVALLGRAPASFEEFVRKTAEEWKVSKV